MTGNLRAHYIPDTRSRNSWQNTRNYSGEKRADVDGMLRSAGTISRLRVYHTGNKMVHLECAKLRYGFMRMD